jgi:hypothetical protein
MFDVVVIMDDVELWIILGIGWWRNGLGAMRLAK